MILKSYLTKSIIIHQNARRHLSLYSINAGVPQGTGEQGTRSWARLTYNTSVQTTISTLADDTAIVASHQNANINIDSIPFRHLQDLIDDWKVATKRANKIQWTYKSTNFTFTRKKRPAHQVFSIANSYYKKTKQSIKECI